MSWGSGVSLLRRLLCALKVFAEHGLNPREGFYK